MAKERRDSFRYPINVECKLRPLDSIKWQKAMVVKLSKSGAWVQTIKPLRTGEGVVVTVPWPNLLPGKHSAVPLDLIITGRVVRIEAAYAAIKIIDHHFISRRIGFEIIAKQLAKNGQN